MVWHVDIAGGWSVVKDGNVKKFGMKRECKKFLNGSNINCEFRAVFISSAGFAL